MTHRRLKREALSLLRSDDLKPALEALCEYTPRQIVNPLFGLLYHSDPLIRWRAVSAMGAVVSRMARKEIESARIIMRRFMWNLNDESGGIGWGSPESLGDIMAECDPLACEFACILISYADPKGNYLEHPILQQGVLWAWGRLGRKRPEILKPSAELLIPYLSSEDHHLQGMAAWAAVPLEERALNGHLRRLLTHTEQIAVYENHKLENQSVARMAQSALL